MDTTCAITAHQADQASSNLLLSFTHLLEEARVQFPAEAREHEIIHRGDVGPEDIEDYKKISTQIKYPQCPQHNDMST